MKYIVLLNILPLFLFSQTFSGPSGPITDDNQPNEFALEISNLSSNTLNSDLGLVSVCLEITHTYDSDLEVKLISPSGIMITLFSGIGGPNDNFTNTCLNQTASTSIINGIAPFTGSFSSQESLSNMNNNQNGNGVWKLVIVDHAAQDIGFLNSWSLDFASGAEVPFVLSSSNLPIVIINTDGQTILDEPSIPATMKVIYNGVGNINNVTDVPNNYDGNITIEYRGAFSQSLPQKPFKIETKDALNTDLNVSILGMPEEHDWVLIANYNDKSFIRNTLAYKLFSEMGHYAARSKFCEVVLNGVYQGVYLFMEKIKRDSNRVDIAKLLPSENSGLDLTGGYIIKSDYWNDENSWILNYHPLDHPDFDVRLVYEYPKYDEISIQQKNYIQDYVNDLETSLYSSNYSDQSNGYSKYIDTDSFIDYFIINELSRNNDGFKKSCYFNKDKDGLNAIAKLKAGPVWDFDFAWKNLWGCSIFENTDGSGWAHDVNNCFTDNYSTGWYYRLLQDDNFKNKLRCRWDYLRTTILSDFYINSYIDNTASYLHEAQGRHFEKWNILGNNNTGASEVDSDPTTYEGQIQKLKDWIELRMTWLDQNMPGDGSNCNLGLSTLVERTTLKIYPNPVKYIINLEMIDSTIVLKSAEIFDLKGRRVLEQFVSNKTINVEKLAVGTYTLVVRDGNNKPFIQKIIKE